MTMKLLSITLRVSNSPITAHHVNIFSFGFLASVKRFSGKIAFKMTCKVVSGTLKPSHLNSTRTISIYC